MRVLLTSAIALTVVLAAGCDRPKSPDAVAKDVATAQQKASNEVASTEKDASKDVGKAAEKVDDKLTDLNNAAAKDSQKVDIAKADGDKKIALAKCNALAARNRCCWALANETSAPSRSDCGTACLSYMTCTSSR